MLSWLAVCSACVPPPVSERGLQLRTLVVRDSVFGAVNRSYYLRLPEIIAGPLVLGFHGQGSKASDWANGHTFQDLAPGTDWVYAFPQGMHDLTGSAFDSGWNVGTNGDNSTCLAGTTGTGCHSSCRARGLCGRCSWSSCYDDRAFVTQLLSALTAEFCLTHYFAVGESNGAMFMHELIDSFPSLFLAAVPVFGLPLLGYSTGYSFGLLTQTSRPRTSILQLHDRNDTTIPWQGGASTAGWLYEPLARTLGKWAAIHGCSDAAFSDPSRQVNGSAPDPATHMACFAHPHCTRGAQVAHCMYDGEHGTWPSQPNADMLVMKPHWSVATSGLAATAWVK